MKAAQIHDYGDASVLAVVDVDKPIIKVNQVLVEVHAASLNPFDTKLRAGSFKDSIPLHFPATLGGDIAGKVVAVGEGVDAFTVGDAVYGQAAVVAGNSGAIAEYAATSAGQVAKAPSNIDMNEAASLPLVGVSALQALTEHIALKPGRKILITGGAGGIGRIAIQIAKHLGAFVATTASGEGLDAVKDLGADEVFDYKSADYTQSLRNYDAAFDTVGGDELAKIVKILKDDGIAVSMAGQPVAERSIQAIPQSTHVTTAVLNQLRDLVEAGVIKPSVGKVFSLDQVQAAFAARESGSVAGKIVIEIKQ